MHTEPNEQLRKVLPFPQPTVAHPVATTAQGAFERLLRSLTWARNLTQLSQ